MLENIFRGRIWVKFVASILAFTVGTSPAVAVQPVSVDTQAIVHSVCQPPQALRAEEINELSDRQAVSSGIGHLVAGQNGRVCDACGGSGRGVDFMRRKGLSRRDIQESPGFNTSNCPGCNGTGYIQISENVGKAADESGVGGVVFVAALVGVVILAAMASSANVSSD